MIKVNGDSLEYVQGMTVKTLLQLRNFVFPLLIVKVNGALVPRDQYAQTEVPDGAVVDVIHLMSGG
jgi:sulfur carrier protein